MGKVDDKTVSYRRSVKIKENVPVHLQTVNLEISPVGQRLKPRVSFERGFPQGATPVMGAVCRTDQNLY